jgi:hypothetical protein
MKDIDQKLKAIRYSVACGLVPFLEVRIRYAFEGATSPSDITDLDVLALRPAGLTHAQKVFFDCKTQTKLSAINRALWAQGAKSLAGCSEAFVILTRPAPEAHRLAADSLGVRLFHEALFDEYAATTAPDYKVERSYLCSVESWEALRSAPERFPQLEKLIYFLTTEAPTLGKATMTLRALMSVLRRSRGELDPAKEIHRAIFGVATSQLLLTCAELVTRFHSAFEKTLSKPQFEESLRYYVWDGRDNYEVRRKLSEALQRSKGGEAREAFELPGWEAFVELFRSFLDAPLLVGTAALPCKELALRELMPADADRDLRLARRLGANARVRQFIQFAAAYLVVAVNVPKEFADRLIESAKTALAGVPAPAGAQRSHVQP